MLPQGLQVVLVKDKQSLRSSVALTIDGAGQFSDPPDISGLAHLMEHIVLSSSRSTKTKVIQRKARRLWGSGTMSHGDGEEGDEEDFEDWLSENDGDSNAFTAPGFVCFHFNSPSEILPGELNVRL